LNKLLKIGLPAIRTIYDYLIYLNHFRKVQMVACVRFWRRHSGSCLKTQEYWKINYYLVLMIDVQLTSYNKPIVTSPFTLA
jgi:hypothetical protein